MGTTSEWQRVLELSGLYISFALLWQAIKSKSFKEFVEELPQWLLIGLMWAIMVVFEWRAVHGGIAVVLGILLATLITVGLVQRRARKRRESPSHRTSAA